MAIDFIPPTQKRDLVTATREAVFLTINALPLFTHPATALSALRFTPRAYGHLSKIAKAVTPKDTDAPENKAWVWLSTVLTDATARYLVQLRKHTILNAGQKDGAVGRFLSAAMALPAGAQFHADTLNQGTRNPIFDPAKGALPKLIFDITLLTTLPEDHELTFDDCLREAIRYVTASCNSYFHPLLDAVTNDPGGLGKREQAWRAHSEWLHGRFNRAPIFSTDETVKIPLSEVYLPLRCTWHEVVHEDNQTPDDTSITLRAHLGDMHDTVHRWLDEDVKDRVRIIAGGPGSGKSSFSRALASEVATKGTYRVIYIELQRLKLRGDLRSDIGASLRARVGTAPDGGSAGFAENPLDLLQTSDTRRGLLIFDGLDELTFDDDAAKERARDFLLKLNEMLRHAESDGANLKALVLGRYAACQDAMKKASIDRPALLNVAPIRALTDDDLNTQRTETSDEKIKKIIKPDLSEEATRDHRPDYWANWARANHLGQDAMPPAITDERLSDLNVEPLLLHLLILSGFASDRWQEAAHNRNVVYEELLEQIHSRNAERPGANVPRDYEDFIRLMECLGFAAWRGNGRAGKQDDFDQVVAAHAAYLQEEADIRTDLSSVILQTHARTVDGEDPGFEFIHKSFGEYLAARGLITLAKDTCDASQKGAGFKSKPDRALTWVKTIGMAELTAEVLSFLRDEARRRSPEDTARKVKSSLQALMTWAQSEGMPAHLDGAPNFRSIETRQRCAETALLATGTSVTCALPKEAGCFTLAWHDEKAALNLLQRLQYNILGYAKRSLPRLDLRRALLHMADLREAVLREADLREAKLSRANLSRAVLREADLREAVLREADLREADLREAVLREADLKAANLTRANLREADLRQAVLREADLSGAYLGGAVLKRAYLAGADLTRAYLWKADLKAANLKRAYLWKADLREADLREAVLREADLREAEVGSTDLTDCTFAANPVRSVDLSQAINLTQCQITSMFGVKSGYGKTRLPQGMQAPDFWHTAEEADEDSQELFDAFNAAFEAWKRG